MNELSKNESRELAKRTAILSNHYKHSETFKCCDCGSILHYDNAGDDYNEDIAGIVCFACLSVRQNITQSIESKSRSHSEQHRDQSLEDLIEWCDQQEQQDRELFPEWFVD